MKTINRLLKNIEITASLVETNDLASLERMGQAMLDIYGKLIGEFAEAQFSYNITAVDYIETEEKATDATKKAKASPQYRDMNALECYIDLAKRQHDYIKKLIDSKSREYQRHS